MKKQTLVMNLLIIGTTLIIGVVSLFKWIPTPDIITFVAWVVAGLALIVLGGYGIVLSLCSYSERKQLENKTNELVAVKAEHYLFSKSLTALYECSETAITSSLITAIQKTPLNYLEANRFVIKGTLNNHLRLLFNIAYPPAKDIIIVYLLRIFKLLDKEQLPEVKEEYVTGALKHTLDCLKDEGVADALLDYLEKTEKPIGNQRFNTLIAPKILDIVRNRIKNLDETKKELLTLRLENMIINYHDHVPIKPEVK